MSGASIKWRLSNRSGETGPQAAGLTGHCNIERLEVICLAATFRKRVRDNLRQTRHHTLVPHHYAPPSLVDHRQPGIPSLLLPRENFRPLFHRLRLFQLSIALPFLPPSSLTLPLRRTRLFARDDDPALCPRKASASNRFLCTAGLPKLQNTPPLVSRLPLHPPRLHNMASIVLARTLSTTSTPPTAARRSSRSTMSQLRYVMPAVALLRLAPPSSMPRSSRRSSAD